MKISVVAAQKTHTIQVVQGFQSGKTSSFRVSVFLLLPRFLRLYGSGLSHTSDHPCHSAQPAKNRASKTDEKPTRESVGLMGQVASCRPFPPSSRCEVTERPGWQPRGLPDLSNFR